MKKTLSILLVLALALSAMLSLSGCTKGGSSLIDVNDLDAVKELNHKIYVANLPETLLGNHESYATTWSIPISDQYLDENHYMAENITYDEWSNGACEFAEGRIVYSANYAPDAYSISCGLNLNADASPHYSTILPLDEDVAFNYETDTVTQVVLQDGKIYLRTQYTDAGVQHWMQQYLQRDRVDEKMDCELILDPDTYEIESLTITMEKNGDRQTAFIGTAQYDVPMPVSAQILQSFFKRSSENMMTVTMIADKGTEKELSVSVTLPQNIECTGICEDFAAFFDDPEYQSVSHWDRRSDRTLYVVTNPDAELTARYEKLCSEVRTD